MSQRNKYSYAFEGLEVWQLARKLVGKIYLETERFPDKELYGLTSQLRRASLSVASNIAEGSARKNKKDQGHFYQIAFSSLMEAACQLMISVDLGYLDERDHQILKGDISELSNKLNALHKFCIQSDSAASR